MLMPGRVFQTTDSANYRYSINGQEKEFQLNENITNAQYWEFDSRIGKRWNVDPVRKEWESPFAVFANNPILNVDPSGLFKVKANTSDKKEAKRQVKALNSLIKGARERLVKMNGKEWEAYSKFSGFHTKEEALKMFNDGEGPTLKFSGQNASAGGGLFFTEMAGGNFSDKSAYGSYQNGTITIGDGIYNAIAGIDDYDKTNSAMSLVLGNKKDFGIHREKAFDLYSKILFHENMHYGAEINGFVNQGSSEDQVQVQGANGPIMKERGWAFSEEAYGRTGMNWANKEYGVLNFKFMSQYSFGASTRLSNNAELYKEVERNRARVGSPEKEFKRFVQHHYPELINKNWSK